MMNSAQDLVLDRKDEVDVVALLRVLWRYKITVILITVLFGLASIYYAMTATHIFRAQVVVTKVSEANMSGPASLVSQFGGLASLAGLNVAGGGTGREAQAILESRNLIEEFIKRNDLLPTLSPNGSEPVSLWMAVKQFQELVLTIREDTPSGTTVVVVNWTDPDVAARWANRLVALANELIRTRALEEAAANIDYLNEQIERTNVVGIQNVMYNLIESETKTVMLANAREEYAFMVVDPAVAPEIRTSPNRKVIVMTGTSLGLFLAMFLVWAWNLFLQIRTGG